MLQCHETATTPAMPAAAGVLLPLPLPLLPHCRRPAATTTVLPTPPPRCRQRAAAALPLPPTRSSVALPTAIVLLILMGKG
jgi:hypothetical protein